LFPVLISFASFFAHFHLFTFCALTWIRGEFKADFLFFLFASRSWTLRALDHFDGHEWTRWLEWVGSD
jgi:hypothetical protein